MKFVWRGLNSISLYWLPCVGWVILALLMRRMNIEIQKEVHKTIKSDDRNGIKIILMFRITITEEVFRTAIAIERFFHKQQRPKKKRTPTP